MKNWFRNFLKTFYSPTAIIETKYIKWYWNILYVFVFTFTFVGIWILFLWFNTWNMSNIVALGNNLPAFRIDSEGVLINKIPNDEEEQVYSWSYMSELVNVFFIEDENEIDSIKKEFWGNKGIVIEKDISKNISQEIVDNMNFFLGKDSEITAEVLTFEFYDNEKQIDSYELLYHKKYTAKVNYSEKFEQKKFNLDFTIYQNDTETRDILDSNYFVFNSRSLVFKTNSYHKYFEEVPYKESKIIDYDFRIKNDWKKMINFFMDVTKYDWLPLVTVMFYLTILGYLFVYILLFSFISWIIAFVAKRSLSFLNCCSITTYSLNCPGIVAIVVAMLLRFNILYGLLIMAIGGLLFSFLVLFIYFRGRKTKEIKYLI